jgi:hypothetical protein
MRAVLSLGVVFLCLTLSGGAWAQDKNSIAIIDLEISGDGPPELRQQLQKHIRDGLATGGLKVTDLDQTLKVLQGVPELIGCSSTACLERIFELIPAHRFVRAVVTASGATYEIHLELLSALEDESVVNTVDESCAVCTISDLNTMAAESARKLLRPNENQKVSVMIASNPAGALILIDGIDVGDSPLETELVVGSHTITATLDGHTSSEKTVDVLPDSEQQRFELVLPAIGSITKPGGDETEADYGSMKWMAVGGSAALVTLGAVLISIDGNAIDCNASVSTCAEFRDTKTGGIVSMSGGVLVGALAGWMFWRESSTASSKSSVSVQATKGGAIAGYGFLF